MRTRTGVNLLKAIKKVVNLHRSRGFNVECIYVDREFEKLRNLMKNDDDLKPSLLNTTSAVEHVSAIERRIRVIKERERS